LLPPKARWGREWTPGYEVEFKERKNVSFSINTNIASLQAQQYLRVTSDFQQKTIGRVTSGLRITQSGDDAAGLAIANGYRSDEAVLTQGVRNANDGLSQLQVIDGGINNISQLLDRARTLATQSASGTFTGDRGVLNSEFSSVVGEIDRQAQSIGLNVGGDLAKSLSVFIGGGKTSNGVTAINNGSVGVDLSKSTVDGKSLGLKGVQSIGVANTDIGTGSATTSVAKILADANNTASEAASGYTDFYFAGPGFGDASKVKVTVNLSGVTDTSTLVAAVNNAIANAGNAGTQAATAFKNTNITASVNTDANGKQQLTFNASGTAFQVQAGDRTSNALLGNFTTGSAPDGKNLANTVTGATTTATATVNSVIVRLQGSGLASPVDITLAAGTAQSAIDSLYTQVSQSAALQAAGISVNDATAATGAVTFTSKRGEQFNVEVVGDTKNTLGLGTWAASGANFEYTSITAAAAPTVGGTQTDVLEFSIAGGAVQQASVTLLAADTAQQLVDKLNSAISANSALTAAGLTASLSGGKVKLDSTNGTAFRVREAGGVAANQVLGFATTVTAAALGASASALSGTTTVADNTNNSHFDAGGSSATAAFAFSAIQYGQDSQTITFSASDPLGGAHSASVVLENNATARNARSLDEAISTINQQLQQSNDSTLNQIVAVKEYDTTAHADTVKFISTLNNFSVSIGQAGTGAAAGIGAAADQGKVATSSALAGGGTADISNQASAQAAVTALLNAVSNLGRAQAVVGRGQNQLNYAVNLAQSQLTNLAAAESRVRDADLASEAANLTKAQVLLQAGIAALAQANSAPQQVLALLRS
jgi:flagellin